MFLRDNRLPSKFCCSYTRRFLSEKTTHSGHKPFQSFSWPIHYTASCTRKKAESMPATVLLLPQQFYVGQSTATQQRQPNLSKHGESSAHVHWRESLV